MRYHFLGHKLHRSYGTRKLVSSVIVVLLFIIGLLTIQYKSDPYLINHPKDSKYKHIVDIVFKLISDNDHLQTHELTEDLFNHQFVPFRDINNDLVLNQINNHTPYDMNPNLYWAILLEQILHDPSNIKFAWYDFVENRQYNSLLRIHYNKFENVKISCKTVNFKSIPKDILNLDGSFMSSNSSLPETLRTNGIFIKDLINRYTSSSFLIKNKNGQYDPHQVCIDQDHKLSVFHKEAKEHLQNVDFYLSPFLQTELRANVRPEVYGLQATSYVINNQKDPLGVILLKFFDYNKEIYNCGLRYYDINSEKFQKDNKSPLMGENYDTLGVYEQFKDQISLNQEDLLAKFNTLEFDLNNDEPIQPLELPKDRFLFNIKATIKRLESMDSLTKSQTNYLESLKYYNQIHYSQATKHFDEPGSILQFRGKGNHYDSLFFHTNRLEENPQLKQASIHNLLLTLQNLVSGMGLAGWISHGNLLSWSYNGLNFPWDEDVDYQMPIQDLHKLAELANNTIILQDPQYGNGKYFLNVGNLLGRTHGNGKNNIDARLIDVDTGLYIDITGLSYNGEVVSERQYDMLFDFFKDNMDHVETWLEEGNDLQDDSTTDIDKLDSNVYLNKLTRDVVIDKKERQNMIKKCKDTLVKENNNKKKIWENIPKDPNDIDEEDQRIYDLIHAYLYDITYQQRLHMNMKMDLVTCKNRHFSKTADLQFLRPTFFQRIPLYVPAGYYSLLTQEYKKIDTENNIHDDFLEYQRYVYLPILKTWIDKQSAASFLNLPHKIFNEGDYTNDDNCVNLSDESINNLDLEQSELLLVNMCDISGHKFNNILTISDIAEQFDQKKYRYSELKVELNSGIDNYFETQMFSLKPHNQFHIDPYLLNNLYERYFESDRPYEKDVCLKNVFSVIQNMEDTYSAL